MAVPRPIALLAALAVVLLAATFVTVRSAREQAQADQISKAAVTAQPTPVAPVVKPKTHSKANAKAHQRPAAKHEAVAKPNARKAPAKPHPVVKPGPTKRKDPGTALGLPGAVARAIGDHKTVVVLFYHRGTADDDATARAVRSVRSKRVSVFTASPRQFGNYKQLVSGLALSSLPATVIVGRDRAARVIEGFVDPQTLAQEVADSAR
ncbi:MAG: hypothetical protein QOI11_3912 [Candidatus Eremiobacteraeota bacterium]|nr:hypothetical protein [Candidatus Eremiobacteraeota bacterium]